MQKSLRDMLDLIDECLAESDVRHTKIISKLNGLQRSSDKIDKGGKKCLSRSLGVFAPPYFKDLEGYSHPPNPGDEQIFMFNFSCTYIYLYLMEETNVYSQTL